MGGVVLWMVDVKARVSPLELELGEALIKEASYFSSVISSHSTVGRVKDWVEQAILGAGRLTDTWGGWWRRRGRDAEG